MRCAQPPQDSGFPGEREAINDRRNAVGIDAKEPIVGLALSGGGIRSATFCLGLMRGLAQNQVLSRFDYVSTVSGGGYIGAAFGRLVSHMGIYAAEEEMARGNSRTLQWLRQYGRYLTPRGARDFGVAIATYMRSAVAIHLELGALALLVAVLVVMPHAYQMQRNVMDPIAWRPWLTVWWPLGVAYWLAMAPGAMSSFWSLRDFGHGVSGKWARTAIVDIMVLVGLALFTWWLIWKQPWPCGTTYGCTVGEYFGIPLRSAEFRWAFVVALASVVIRGASTFLRVAVSGDRPLRVRNALQRQRLTLSLRRTNTTALILVLAGALDLVTWRLMDALGRGPAWLFGSVGLGSLVVAFGRTMLEPLQKLTERAEGPRVISFGTAMNVIGIVIGVALLIGWVTFAQWFVFGTSNQGAPAWLPASPISRGCLLAIVPAFWILITAANSETTNTTSLHSFYRGRLTRAYLRVGNPAFHGSAGGGRIQDVAAFEAGDDVNLADYKPEEKGGPIHLVTACVNQTRVPASGVYNADRKGMRLTASRFGFEIDNELIPMSSGADFGTLGQWVAISGAAAAPGAGSYTSSGWAMLLFMTGVRLGYWFPAVEKPPGSTSSPFIRYLRDTKYGRFTSEALARFYGAEERAWFVSDGGHFENTGVHALLKRRAAFIVVADCGADPEFALQDLENLIRKARIDYDAEIEFYSDDANQQFGTAPNSLISILAPEQLQSNYSARGVLLARVTYRNGKADPSEWTKGTIVVVKPNLHNMLDSDILAYARRNPAFPQQSTSDQFFDEAQWESYHRLGEDFGRGLTSAWLSKLPCWSAAVPDPDDKPLRQPDKRPDDEEPKPFWRTETKAAALGATLGVSALAALALPAWQVIGDVRANREGIVKARSELVANAYRVAPAWARDGQQPTDNVNEFKADFMAQQTIQQLYQKVKDEREASADDAGIALIRTLQEGCQIARQAPSLRLMCPHMALRELCRSVCDRDVPEDSYWPTPRQAAASGSAPPVTLTKEELKQIGSSWPKAVSHPSTPMAPAASAGASSQPSVPSALSFGDACRNTKLYAQVYDDRTRQKVASLALQYRDLGQWQGVENVVSSALVHGRPAPYRWLRPTLVVHNLESDGVCAAALQSFLRAHIADWYSPSVDVDIRKLPSGFKGEKATIELWFPPVNPAIATSK